MRAWLYLIAAAVAGGDRHHPAIFVLILLGGDLQRRAGREPGDADAGRGIAVVTMRDIIRCGLAMIVCFGASPGCT